MPLEAAAGWGKASRGGLCCSKLGNGAGILLELPISDSDLVPGRRNGVGARGGWGEADRACGGTGVDEAEDVEEGRVEEWEMETAVLGLEEEEGQEGEEDEGRGREEEAEEEEMEETW